MRTINLHEAKAHLSRLVDQAAAGESFVIAKAGRPLVRVMPLDAPQSGQGRRLGFMAGQIAVPDDFDRLGVDCHRGPPRGTGMRLLLDTHVLLWAAGLPERFSAEARALLEAPDLVPSRKKSCC